jgi:maltose O-acetyltransferase
MIGFSRKLHRFGYRRAIVYVLIRCTISVKAWFYRYFLSDNIPKMDSVKLMTPTQFIGRGSITIKNAQLGVWPSPYVLKGGYLEARTSEASIFIGEGSFINNGFTIIADRTSVVIGRNCLFGPNFFCTDSDFHGIDIENRSNGKYDCYNVLIEDNVFFGAGVTVLKGVRIGYGAVVGCGSLVASDIEPLTIYAGIPAKKIRMIN